MLMRTGLWIRNLILASGQEFVVGRETGYQMVGKDRRHGRKRQPIKKDGDGGEEKGF
jgi:hypothetical protein